MTDDTRITIASAIAVALAEKFKDASVIRTTTSSSCPMIRLRFSDNQSFNITITRSRS
jgi:hypothetical protein